MADYPALPIDDGTAPQKDAGIRMSIAEDGSVRSRRLYSATLYRFTLVHRQVSSGDRTTLLSHYAAHVGQRFDWTAPWGDLYELEYLDEPAEIPHPNGSWTMTSRLIGTKQ
jgi:hypothetical protein